MGERQPRHARSPARKLSLAHTMNRKADRLALTGQPPQPGTIKL